MTDRDANLVHSGLSRNVTADGITVQLEIYRLKDEPNQWALEVVNEAGTSNVALGVSTSLALLAG